MRDDLPILLPASIVLVLCGLAWRAPVWWLGPGLSLALAVIAPLMPGRRLRWLAACSYFAAGSAGLVPGAGVFFGQGPGSYVFGVVLWLASSALLATPWAFASNGALSLLAMLVDALPPLGLFGWLSPFAAAGILFPGAGMIGLLLLAGSMLTWGTRLRRFVMAAVLMQMIAVHFSVANWGGSRPGRGAPIAGIDTNFGLMPQDPMAVIARNQRLIADLLSASRHAKVVVTPETVATWLPGTAAQFEAAVPAGRTWLIGATTLDGNGTRSDAIVEVRRGQPDQILFRSALPVPVSMWHPWQAAGSYSASWWEPARTIASHRIWASICYDQLLFWPWLNAIEQRPNIILAISNEWWADGTGIPVIQRNTTRAYARLIGARVIWAENR